MCSRSSRGLPGREGADDGGRGAELPRGGDFSSVSDLPQNDQHGGLHQGQDEPQRWHHVRHGW